MAIKHPEEAYLRPFYINTALVFRLENVQDYGHSIFVVIPYNALIRVRGVRLYDSALFLTGLCGLVVLQLDGLGVQRSRVVPE